MKSANFILGDELTAFEEDFAKYCGVKYAVGVASGLDALRLSLMAFDIGRGDEVITVANTFIATVFSISSVGSRPVLVDISPRNFNINIDRIEEAITSRTKAIIPVHLYGQPADMDAINRVARKYNLIVIEDACQAHGAKYNDQPCGSLGDIGCFSFYPGKNLGAFGDGGLVVTNNHKIAEKVGQLRNYGQKIKYHHVVKGFNSRLDTLQAVVLRIKLKRLDRWNNLRRINAQLYNSQLQNLDVLLPYEEDYARHIYHVYVIRVTQRDALAKYLAGKGVSTGIHYPIPIHLQDAYKDLGFCVGAFPISERYANEILSLPMYPELSEEQIQYVCDLVRSFIIKS